MNLREKLESLRLSHYICEDCFYSCPKSGECCNDSERDGPCNCGADRRNSIVDEILLANP